MIYDDPIYLFTRHYSQYSTSRCSLSKMYPDRISRASISSYVFCHTGGVPGIFRIETLFFPYLLNDWNLLIMLAITGGTSLILTPVFFPCLTFTQYGQNSSAQLLAQVSRYALYLPRVFIHLPNYLHRLNKCVRSESIKRIVPACLPLRLALWFCLSYHVKSLHGSEAVSLILQVV